MDQQRTLRDYPESLDAKDLGDLAARSREPGRGISRGSLPWYEISSLDNGLGKKFGLGGSSYQAMQR